MLTTSEELDVVLRREYRSSLYLTAKDLLGYKDINRHTHGEMIAALEAPTKRKLIVMPRGTFKSSIGVVAYSIWTLLRDPNARILIDSELYTNSKNFLREIKAHLERPELTELFGTFRTDSNWTEGEITIAQRTQSFKESSIVAGGIGTTKVGAHFSHLIGDDYNSGNNSDSKEGCEKVINHYRMNLAILEPWGTYIIIGTRYSELDLIGHVMSEEINPQPVSGAV